MDVTQFFDLPQAVAAARLNFSASLLTKRWKEATSGRKWPHKALVRLRAERDKIKKRLGIADEISATSNSATAATTANASDTTSNAEKGDSGDAGVAAPTEAATAKSDADSGASESLDDEERAELHARLAEVEAKIKFESRTVKLRL